MEEQKKVEYQNESKYYWKEYMKTFGAHLQEQIKETSYRFVYLWFEDPDDPVNSVFYIGIILVFTAFILWIAKQGLDYILQLIFLSAKKFLVFFILYLYSSFYHLQELNHFQYY